MHRKIVLDNGVRVVTERMPSAKSVTVGIGVNVGSRDEEKGEEGFSHFIEHMFFKGTRTRSAMQISREIDALGGEMIASAREADLLVNVTNDAWYGRSIAALQHNQIAATRALEFGRPMLRATNTGITSYIGPDGRDVARLPWFTTGILEASVVGRDGETPYMQMGDTLVLVLCALLVVVPIGVAWRR